MGLMEVYHRYNTELADERTNDWLLISSPVPLTILSIIYLYFILYYGPIYMKDKKPYSFKTFIYWYNIFQIVTNFMVVQQALATGWYEDGFMYCTKLDYSYDYKPYKMTKILWYIFCLKVIDYIETILYVLRKKYRQISVLHVYHHISTAYIVWAVVKYYPNGYSMTFAMVNCTVHVIMYTYYLLSSFRGVVQKIVQPIKPIITMVQMIQFVGLITYGLQAFKPGCSGSSLAATIMITNLSVNLTLFANFYRQNYLKKNKKSID
ncbi:PREDICTED: elongation of very long chain fatty acids protein 4-like [Dufourea novaeangliae]|uniref:elongation of very long chain fatty acids protein 4-like n=1 Tax=Dufourea novaeangliae TaxID=178035 RepID=UPI0007675FB7|nr:PREDICTED: elongation of very long chain fatty acids protein 4-like [Dufourea novaeangliae]